MRPWVQIQEISVSFFHPLYFFLPALTLGDSSTVLTRICLVGRLRCSPLRTCVFRLHSAYLSGKKCASGIRTRIGKFLVFLSPAPACTLDWILLLLQICPAELEMLLLEQAGVKEVCVLGRRSASGVDDLPVAFVSRTPDEVGQAITEDLLKNLVATRMADYKQLRGGVIFLEELPRTVSGKIARKEMRELLSKMAAR